MLYTIRVKLVFMILLFISAFTVVITAYWARSYTAELRAGFEAALTQTATFLAPPLAAAIWNFEDYQVRKTLLGLDVNPAYRFARIVADGELFLEHTNDESDFSVWADVVSRVPDLPADIGKSGEITFFDDHQIAVIRAPLVIDTDRVVGDVMFGFSTDAIRQSQDDLYQRAVGIAVISFGIAGTFIFLLASSFTRPLARVARMVQYISDGELDFENKERTRRDEVGRIARAVDEFREKNGAIRELERDRQRMLDKLATSVGTVVAKAVDGEFSERVEAEFDDAVLNELATGINDLLATVDRGLDDVQSSLTSLAGGDLNASMTGNYSGAFRRLSDCVNTTFDKLHEIIGQIDDSSRVLTESAIETKRIADDLSQRSRHQATELEATSQAVENVSELVQKSAATLDEMDAQSRSALEQATSGERIIEEGTVSISELDQHSDRILEVVGVIEGIAFQTNLIALNASVEAARAGETGTGFAVVAKEIRALAERAKSEAGNVSSLIAENSVRTGRSVDQMRKAGALIKDNIVGIRELSIEITRVSEAAAQQASQASNITNSVSELDDMTQHNASLADQGRTSAERLSAAAEGLMKSVGVFRKEPADAEGEIDASNTKERTSESPPELQTAAG
ncbi:methyl-accepting chemotaxis protein [Litoreibacter roseus]|uniref:Methyl-accepting chemotaxis protein n=1 Tax=Litoreibacter roseus TaxID=2601869 RepID=A0A6N6JFE5_9RHOB|nr:methyl-accepting chemotaxis protein [Litoreibacter roseus]GFE64946.1 hypothetical protein KIN_20200 [Litoreibacter roseus]